MMRFATSCIAILLSTLAFGQGAGYKNQSAPLTFWLMTPASPVATAGTVTSTAPVPPTGAIPGSVTAAASTALSCSAVGNAVPATAVAISCSHLGASSIPPFTIPLPPGSSYFMQQQYNGDSVTFLIGYNAAGALVWSASATPSGGTAATATGNF